MTSRDVEVYVGMRFANGWVITKRIGYAEGKALGLGGHNVHWEATNEYCGVTYMFENTCVKRWVANGVGTLKKCLACKSGGGCHYGSQNYKVITKKIDRKPLDCTIGKVYGQLTIAGEDFESETFSDHHRHVTCKCANCGGYHFMRHDDIKDGRLPCRHEGLSDLTVPKGVKILL